MNKKNDKIFFEVKEEQILLDYVMNVLKGISRNKAKAILSGGGIKINGIPQTYFAFTLHKGDKIEISKTKSKELFQNKWIKIVYEDNDLLVVDKKEGILSMSQQNRLFSVKTILDSYLRNSRQKCTAHVIHRLDRDTSGLLIYAKSIKVQQLLIKSWRDLVFDRKYIAVVHGKLQGKGTERSWLKDNEDYISYSSKIDNGGKYAVTHYQSIYSNDECSLVELKLETGRKNQIRVHLQDLGHPVCGDIKYGDGYNPIERLGLHAYKLSFYHPITKKALVFETPIPKIFMQLFR